MAQVQTQATTMTAENAGTSTPAVPARILKKRETDRRCQRMIRERTKSRIAYLEGLVEQFRQQDSSGRVETLMKQLSDMKDERDNLAKKVKNIESIISDSKCKAEPDTQSPAVSRIAPQLGDSDTTPSLSIEAHPSYTLPPAALIESPPTYNPQDMAPAYAVHNKEYAAYIESSSRSSWATSPLQSTNGQPCECSTTSSALDPSTPFNKWRWANDTLTEWFKWSPQALNLKQYAVYNDDVPIRAVVEGWDAVEEKGFMHPLWRLLKAIDQVIFRSCGQRERLAILQTMGLLMQAHMNPTKKQESKLPSFYLKRPSQDMLHSYATEYFIWPGLRERFVFGEHLYCSNLFWKVFCPNLRIQWPYEFRDCYVRNTETGLYHISPAFQERISDVRHWTAGIDLFKQYPEFYGDIPADNHIPASMTSVPDMARQYSRTLPPTSLNQDVQNSGKKRDRHDIQNKRNSVHSHVEQQSPALQDLALPLQSQNMVTHYSPLSTESYDPTNATAYDFPHQSIVTSMADMQHLQAMTPWGYNQGLDMFQLPGT